MSNQIQYPYCPECSGDGEIWILDEPDSFSTDGHFADCLTCDGTGEAARERSENMTNQNQCSDGVCKMPEPSPQQNLHDRFAAQFPQSEFIKTAISDQQAKGEQRYGQALTTESTFADGTSPTIETTIRQVAEELVDAGVYGLLGKELGCNHPSYDKALDCIEQALKHLQAHRDLLPHQP